VQFDIEQRFSAPPDAVLAAFADPTLYAAMAGHARVDRPDLLGVETDGDAVVVRVRYRFTAELPAAALAVIDPGRLSWVEETRYDHAASTSVTRLLPDHYAERIIASARSTFAAPPGDPSRTVRRISGQVQVRVPLVGGKVEAAIVDGLREHLDEQAEAVTGHLSRTDRAD
jgi:hypothetical protein